MRDPQCAGVIDRDELRLLLEGFEDGMKKADTVSNCDALTWTEQSFTTEAIGMRIAVVPIGMNVQMRHDTLLSRLACCCLQHWLTDEEVEKVLHHYDTNGAVNCITSLDPCQNAR